MNRTDQNNEENDGTSETRTEQIRTENQYGLVLCNKNRIDIPMYMYTCVYIHTYVSKHMYIHIHVSFYTVYMSN